MPFSIPTLFPGNFALKPRTFETLMRSFGLFSSLFSSSLLLHHANPNPNPNSLDPSPSAMSGRSTSFHGAAASDRAIKIRRPESQPDLSGPSVETLKYGAAAAQRPMKLLLNVTVLQSPGPIQVVMSPENTVADLVRAAVEAFIREGRRPPLPFSDPKAFELHYSQYSLESLKSEEKLMNLGSRNFFLCAKTTKNPTQRMTVMPSV
ncbi:hypothetical protein IHE45_01G072600 [Dioscorea alata]|uniref:Uncharacterized protein n=1 Tax=Dioscorea alata TaxID=55571 RepID=A0ACB7WVJ2_DIOAL|nr:hypothetical protein IHE45_01G072600 [Dioscorea alata]